MAHPIGSWKRPRSNVRQCVCITCGLPEMILLLIRSDWAIAHSCHAVSPAGAILVGKRTCSISIRLVRLNNN
jgi:hypothetical protein